MSILKKVNRRIHVKLYEITFDKEGNVKNAIRIKKSIAENNDKVPIHQIDLNKIENVYSELRIKLDIEESNQQNIKTYLNKTWKNLNSEISSNNEVLTIDDNYEEKKILYANEILFKTQKDNLLNVSYIIEIRNIDHETYHTFYDKPEVSFLRMLLDFYFKDFYLSDEKNYIKINEEFTIPTKYNEDTLQFNRRITRLFFGKMQEYVLTSTNLNDFGHDFENKLNNQYYVNSLLEKIDDISALTYENASPFGSILFVNEEVIAEQKFIRFTIKFTKEDRILLEDAKRIRKLLEITNSSNDLYLIANGKEVYGLGEVNWSFNKKNIVLKIDFNGLSKYNLILIETENDCTTNGELMIENNKKKFLSYIQLKELLLLSVSFKNPLIGEEDYSPEKFKRLLMNVFFENSELKNGFLENIDNLNRIVNRARNQKHGTMVVITESIIAKQELIKLSKQSTLIEPKIIEEKYIDFLTSIDGAVYFDIEGKCHAIGVILDGIATESIGDSSRGARYNSAQRYLKKLKDDEEKKCVIVIISEDGNVNLIPELENEDMLLSTAEELIDLINDSKSANDLSKQKDLEEKLLNSRIIDYDWLLNIANKFYEKDELDKAILFYNNGFERTKESYYFPIEYHRLGICYYRKKKYMDAIKAYEISIRNTQSIRLKEIDLYNIGISHLSCVQNIKDDKEVSKEDSMKNEKKKYNHLQKAIEYLSQGIESHINRKSDNALNDFYKSRSDGYFALSNIEKRVDEKTSYIKKSINDINEAIKIAPQKDLYFYKRAMMYQSLGQFELSIDDLISAIQIKNDNDLYYRKLEKLLDRNPQQASKFIEKIEISDNNRLQNLFLECVQKHEGTNEDTNNDQNQ